MKEAVTSYEMKKIEKEAVDAFHISYELLMERAACACAEEIMRRFHKNSKVLILCGGGNNGGDGAAIGRILYLEGYEVTLWLPEHTMKEGTLLEKQMFINHSYQIPMVSLPDDMNFDLLIDAYIGIGLNDVIRKEKVSIIEKFNSFKGYKIAIDIPSGIHSDSGAAQTAFVKADLTIVLGYMKKGLLLEPGKSACGEIILREIGLRNPYVENEDLITYYLESKELELIPRKAVTGNKGDCGKIFMVAGSDQMPGAAYLCAKACYSTGAGMLKLFTTEKVMEFLLPLLPECLFQTYQKGDMSPPELEELKKNLEWADTICIGPGCSVSEELMSIITFCLLNKEKRHIFIFDGDAFSIFKKKPELMDLLHDPNIILTPHLKELSGITGITVKELKENREESLKRIEKELNCIIVSKDCVTLIADRQGHIYYNTSGNEALAKAGSGDVLCGIIAGYAGLLKNSVSAAKLGTYIHGYCADKVVESKSKEAFMPHDMIKILETL